MAQQSNEWVLKTSPTEPSFCLLYWRSTRGYQEIIWEGSGLQCNAFFDWILNLGPEHMRSFAENTEVLQALKNAALSRVSFQGGCKQSLVSVNL